MVVVKMRVRKLGGCEGLKRLVRRRAVLRSRFRRKMVSPVARAEAQAGSPMQTGVKGRHRING